MNRPPRLHELVTVTYRNRAWYGFVSQIDFKNEKFCIEFQPGYTFWLGFSEAGYGE